MGGKCNFLSVFTYRGGGFRRGTWWGENAVGVVTSGGNDSF